MINVEQMYQSLRDLSTKGKGGYTDSTEFNRNSKRAELLLWQYYFSIYESTRRVPEQMFVFLTNAALSLDAAGAFVLPSDFGHFTNIQYSSAVNGADCGSAPVVTKIPVRYLDKSELLHTIESPIRGASIAKKRVFYSYRTGAMVQLYPELLIGQVAAEYLRQPTFAVRGWTLDATNDEQAYSAGASTNYEWQPQDENNLMDILLLFHGIISRDTPLLQWAQSHQSITQQVVI